MPHSSTQSTRSRGSTARVPAASLGSAKARPWPGHTGAQGCGGCVMPGMRALSVRVAANGRDTAGRFGACPCTARPSTPVQGLSQLGVQAGTPRSKHTSGPVQTCPHSGPTQTQYQGEHSTSTVARCGASATAVPPFAARPRAPPWARRPGSAPGCRARARGRCRRRPARPPGAARRGPGGRAGPHRPPPAPRRRHPATVRPSCLVIGYG